MSVCSMSGRKHWLFCLCHSRHALLIRLAANDDCNVFPPSFAAKLLAWSACLCPIFLCCKFPFTETFDQTAGEKGGKEAAEGTAC